MALFESMLTLLLVAILLLQLSRGLPIPYPALMATAGVVVALLPWAPAIEIDPQLALVLFLSPVLLDAAYDLPPRSLRPHWPSLFALAAVAVLLTTAAVAWVGVTMAGLPIAAAIALGAIVAPPDAAAAVAMLGRFTLPRATVTVLKGESLLNDATALLIFGAALDAASSGSFTDHLPQLALAAPGGLVLGVVFGLAYSRIAARVADTLSGTLLQFAATFAVWLLAEHLNLSPVLAVVANAMTIARTLPERISPRSRVHSYAVWEAVVFLLNILAFLLTGLQAREILARLEPGQLWPALGFAAMVLATVVVVRLAWVLLCNRLFHWLAPPAMRRFSLGQGAVVGWCGMRGVVTMAAALGLPQEFPGRDLILLSALAVVLGTLVLQGLTLGPLIRLLRFAPDESLPRDLAKARMALLDAGLATLDGRQDGAAQALREAYLAEKTAIGDGHQPRAVTDHARLSRSALRAKRETLIGLRRRGEIDDDVFHALEQELDWGELAASPPDRFEMVEG
jgi:Na+/H+ antiporter